MNAIEELKKEFSEITRLNHIRSLLGWDELVNLPKGSFGGRAEQNALMSKIVHERLISDRIGNLIKEAEKLTGLDLIDNATLREAKRDYEQEVKLPTELVEEISRTASRGYIKWVEAREKNDFSIFEPLLEKMIGLQIQVAEKLDTHPDLYSTLIDLYEPGATYDWIANINQSRILIASLKNWITQAINLIFQYLHKNGIRINNGILALKLLRA